jgi:hypothetical protein
MLVSRSQASVWRVAAGAVNEVPMPAPLRSLRSTRVETMRSRVSRVNDGLYPTWNHSLSLMIGPPSSKPMSAW